MKLYMIRHGQSEANVKSIFCGQLDVMLTEQGRREAAKCRENLKGIEFDKVYSSDLKRAVETQMLAYPANDVCRMELLRELSVGNLEKMPFAEAIDKYPGLWEQWYNWDFSAYGGECYDDFRVRVGKFLELVADSGDSKVAVFCHGGFIQTVCDIILGTRLIKNVIACNNCSIFVFEYTKDKIWKMITANFTGNI